MSAHPKRALHLNRGKYNAFTVYVAFGESPVFSVDEPSQVALLDDARIDLCLAHDIGGPVGKEAL